MRHGTDEKLKKGDHIFAVVYREMLLQISRDYAGLPDIRTLKVFEIRFFYNGMRNELHKNTTSKG